MIGADEIKDESKLSKETERLIEISLRLKSLREALPFIEEFRDLANQNKQKIIEEIVNLEEEKESLSQGQFIF